MKKEFPYLTALLEAEDLHITWGFDEQQADPINRSWDWKKAKKELEQLLKSDLLLCTYDDLLTIMDVANTRLRHIKKNSHDVTLKDDHILRQEIHSPK
jgi:hypothetical protein